MMLEAVAPLGHDYVAAMAQGPRRAAGWTSTRARASYPGAHMAGDAYDVHPYLLINYNDNYESVTTIAHEWGHAMHSYLSNKAQPFATADYAIFVAEIASTLNEALLLRLRAEDGEDRRRAAALPRLARSRACAARSSARRCSRSSSARSTRASTRASR